MRLDIVIKDLQYTKDRPGNNKKWHQSHNLQKNKVRVYVKRRLHHFREKATFVGICIWLGWMQVKHYCNH